MKKCYYNIAYKEMNNTVKSIMNYLYIEFLNKEKSKQQIKSKQNKHDNYMYF